MGNSSIRSWEIVTQVTYRKLEPVSPSKEQRIVVETSDLYEIVRLAPKGTSLFELQYFIKETLIVNGAVYERYVEIQFAEQKSGRCYFLDGDVYCIERVKAKFGRDPRIMVLIHNLETFHCTHAIKFPNGVWLPFNENEDIVL